jgi:peptide/nickel transport system substrate-binding protein
MTFTRSTRLRRHAYFLVGCLVLIAVVAAGCQGSGPSDTAEGGQSSSNSEPSDANPPGMGGRLVVGIPAESNGWNPYIDQWSDSGTLVGTSMIEPLAVQDNEGRAQPWLAEKWEPNSDFTEWTITVRDGVTFHDGSKLDAEAVKISLDESYLTGLYQYALGPLYDRVDVTGPMTVRVHLTLRWAQYPTSLANQWIMAPSMIEREDKGVTDPVGTGPFRFVNWDEGKSLVVKRFDDYWRKDSRGQQLPYLDAIEFRPIIHDDVRADALRSHEIDLALSAGGDIATRLAEDFDVIKDYTGQRTYLMLNTAEGEGNKGNPFVNVHARRALAYATDRERIAEIVGPDVQVTTYGFRPDSPWAPDGPDGYVAYDPDTARREVERYKKATGASTFRFTVNALPAVEIQNVLQALRTMWQEVGIEAEIDTHESAKLTVLTALGQYHATWFRLYDFPDPDQMYFYLSSQNVHPVDELSLNFTRYSSDTLDANLAIVRESLDDRKRKAASDEIIRETNRQVINLWLYDTPASLVSRKEVRGLDGFVTHTFNNNLPKPWLAEAWLVRH